MSTHKEASRGVLRWRTFHFKEIRWLVAVAEDCVEPGRFRVWKLHLLEITGESSLRVWVGKVGGAVGAGAESGTRPQGARPMDQATEIGQPELVT
jgi:hypothetical protein